MKKDELIKWQDKNERLNKDFDLKLGVKLIDSRGYRGVVVQLEPPTNETVEDHGTIYVWQIDRVGYGDDNCEHYTYSYWQRNLRVID
jgi:hypothetical protein